MQTNTRFDELLDRLRTVQQELEQEVDHLLVEKQKKFRYTLRRGKVEFEREMRRLQRRQRTGLWRYLRQTPLAYIVSAPVIYAMVIPLAILDLSMTLYQQICFRIYGIPLVPRGDYVVIDRGHLAYLNAIEKLNCTYCGYGNGVIAYGREITARTEQFWCPIKHARRAPGAHDRVDKYFDYGDVEAWRQGLERVRRDWEQETPVR